MITPHETEPAETKNQSQCVCYYRDGDDSVSQEDLTEHVAGIITEHDLAGPQWIVDNSRELLFADRDGGARLMEMLQLTDHLVITLTAVPNVYEWTIVLRRLMRRCRAVHVVGTDRLYLGNEELLANTEDYIVHLQRESYTNV